MAPLRDGGALRHLLAQRHGEHRLGEVLEEANQRLSLCTRAHTRSAPMTGMAGAGAPLNGYRGR